MAKRSVLRIIGIAVMATQAVRAGNTASVPPAEPAHSAFHIKPGLWEFQETPTIAGATIISDAMLATIPPAQRADYLVKTRKMLGEPSRVRECITQATFEQRVFLAEDGCAQTVVSNTASRIEVVTECRGEGAGTTHYNLRKLAASEPTHVSTSMHAVVSRGGETMTIDNLESGDWLSADCGDVKGIEQLR